MTYIEEQGNMDWRAAELKAPCNGDNWVRWERLSSAPWPWAHDGRHAKACYTCAHCDPDGKCLGFDGFEWAEVAGITLQGKNPFGPDYWARVMADRTKLEEGLRHE